MTKILKFQQDEDTCECPYCELANIALEEILVAESHEELEDIIADLVSHVRTTAYREALLDDVDNKLSILDGITEDECDCEECCNDECEFE